MAELVPGIGERQRVCAAGQLRARKQPRQPGIVRFRQVDAEPLGKRTIEGEQLRSEEHTSELQSLMRISYAVFCLKKKQHSNQNLHSTYLAYKQRPPARNPRGNQPNTSPYIAVT